MFLGLTRPNLHSAGATAMILLKGLANAIGLDTGSSIAGYRVGASRKHAAGVGARTPRWVCRERGLSTALRYAGFRLGGHVELAVYQRLADFPNRAGSDRGLCVGYWTGRCVAGSAGAQLST